METSKGKPVSLSLDTLTELQNLVCKCSSLSKEQLRRLDSLLGSNSTLLLQGLTIYARSECTTSVALRSTAQQKSGSIRVSGASKSSTLDSSMLDSSALKSCRKLSDLTQARLSHMQRICLTKRRDGMDSGFFGLADFAAVSVESMVEHWMIERRSILHCLLPLINAGMNGLDKRTTTVLKKHVQKWYHGGWYSYMTDSLRNSVSLLSRLLAFPVALRQLIFDSLIHEQLVLWQILFHFQEEWIYPSKDIMQGLLDLFQESWLLTGKFLDSSALDSTVTIGLPYSLLQSTVRLTDEHERQLRHTMVYQLGALTNLLPLPTMLGQLPDLQTLQNVDVSMDLGDDEDSRVQRRRLRKGGITENRRSELSRELEDYSGVESMKIVYDASEFASVCNAWKKGLMQGPLGPEQIHDSLARSLFVIRTVTCVAEKEPSFPLSRSDGGMNGSESAMKRSKTTVMVSSPQRNTIDEELRKLVLTLDMCFHVFSNLAWQCQRAMNDCRKHLGLPEKEVLSRSDDVISMDSEWTVSRFLLPIATLKGCIDTLRGSEYSSDLVHRFQKNVRRLIDALSHTDQWSGISDAGISDTFVSGLMNTESNPRMPIYSDRLDSLFLACLKNNPSLCLDLWSTGECSIPYERCESWNTAFVELSDEIVLKKPFNVIQFLQVLCSGKESTKHTFLFFRGLHHLPVDASDLDLNTTAERVREGGSLYRMTRAMQIQKLLRIPKGTKCWVKPHLGSDAASLARSNSVGPSMARSQSDRLRTGDDDSLMCWFTLDWNGWLWLLRLLFTLRENFALSQRHRRADQSDQRLHLSHTVTAEDDMRVTVSILRLLVRLCRNYRPAVLELLSDIDELNFALKHNPATMTRDGRRSRRRRRVSVNDLYNRDQSRSKSNIGSSAAFGMAAGLSVGRPMTSKNSTIINNHCVGSEPLNLHFLLFQIISDAIADCFDTAKTRMDVASSTTANRTRFDTPGPRDHESGGGIERGHSGGSSDPENAGLADELNQLANHHFMEQLEKLSYCVELLSIISREDPQSFFIALSGFRFSISLDGTRREMGFSAVFECIMILLSQQLIVLKGDSHNDSQNELGLRYLWRLVSHMTQLTDTMFRNHSLCVFTNWKLDLYPYFSTVLRLFPVLDHLTVFHGFISRRNIPLDVEFADEFSSHTVPLITAKKTELELHLSALQFLRTVFKWGDVSSLQYRVQPTHSDKDELTAHSVKTSPISHTQRTSYMKQLMTVLLVYGEENSSNLIECVLLPICQARSICRRMLNQMRNEEYRYFVNIVHVSLECLLYILQHCIDPLLLVNSVFSRVGELAEPMNPGGVGSKSKSSMHNLPVLIEVCLGILNDGLFAGDIQCKTLCLKVIYECLVTYSRFVRSLNEYQKNHSDESCADPSTMQALQNGRVLCLTKKASIRQLCACLLDIVQRSSMQLIATKSQLSPRRTSYVMSALKICDLICGCSSSSISSHNSSTMMIVRMKECLTELDNSLLFRLLVGQNSLSSTSSSSTSDPKGLMTNAVLMFDLCPQMLCVGLKILGRLYSDMNAALHEYLHPFHQPVTTGKTTNDAFWESVFDLFTLSDLMLDPPLLGPYVVENEPSNRSDPSSSGLSRTDSGNTDSSQSSVLSKVQTFDRIKQGQLSLTPVVKSKQSSHQSLGSLDAEMDRDLQGDSIPAVSHRARAALQFWQYRCWKWCLNLISEEIKQTIPLLEAVLPLPPAVPVQAKSPFALPSANDARRSLLPSDKGGGLDKSMAMISFGNLGESGFVTAKTGPSRSNGFSNATTTAAATAISGSSDIERVTAADGRVFEVSGKQARKYRAAQAEHERLCASMKKFNKSLISRRRLIQKLLTTKLFSKQPEQYVVASAYLKSRRKQISKQKGLKDKDEDVTMTATDPRKHRRKVRPTISDGLGGKMTEITMKKGRKKKNRYWWLDHVLYHIPARDWLLDQVRDHLMTRLSIDEDDFKHKQKDDTRVGADFVDDVQIMSSFVSNLMASYKLANSEDYPSLKVPSMDVDRLIEDPPSQKTPYLSGHSGRSRKRRFSHTMSDYMDNSLTSKRSRKFRRMSDTDLFTPRMADSVQSTPIPGSLSSRSIASASSVAFTIPVKSDAGQSESIGLTPSQFLQMNSVIERYNLQESYIYCHRQLLQSWNSLMTNVQVCCPNVIGLNPLACEPSSVLPIEQLLLPLQIIRSMDDDHLNGDNDDDNESYVWSKMKDLNGQSKNSNKQSKMLLLEELSESPNGLLSKLCGNITLTSLTQMEASELYRRMRNTPDAGLSGALISMSAKSKKSLVKPIPDLMFYPGELALSIVSGLHSNLESVLLLPGQKKNSEDVDDDEEEALTRSAVRRKSIDEWTERFENEEDAQDSSEWTDDDAHCCLEWMDEDTQQSQIASFVKVAQSARDLVTVLTHTESLDGDDSLSEDNPFGGLDIDTAQNLLSHLVSSARMVSEFIVRKQASKAAQYFGETSLLTDIQFLKDDDNLKVLLNLLLNGSLPLIRWLSVRVEMIDHGLCDENESSAVSPPSSSSLPGWTGIPSAASARVSSSLSNPFGSPVPSKKLYSDFARPSTGKSGVHFEPIPEETREQLKREDDEKKQTIDDDELAMQGKDEASDNDSGNNHNISNRKNNRTQSFSSKTDSLKPMTLEQRRWLKMNRMCLELLNILKRVDFMHFNENSDDTNQRKKNHNNNNSQNLREFDHCTINLSLFPFLLKFVPQWSSVIKPWLNDTKMVLNLLQQFGGISTLLTQLARQMDTHVNGIDANITNLNDLYNMSKSDRTMDKLHNLRMKREILRREFRNLYVIRTQHLSEIVNCICAIAEHSSGEGWLYLSMNSDIKSMLFRYLTNCSLLKHQRFTDPYFTSDKEENPRHELWCRVLSLVTFFLGRMIERLPRLQSEKQQIEQSMSELQSKKENIHHHYHHHQQRRRDSLDSIDSVLSQCLTSSFKQFDLDSHFLHSNKMTDQKNVDSNRINDDDDYSKLKKSTTVIVMNEKTLNTSTIRMNALHYQLSLLNEQLLNVLEFMDEIQTFLFDFRPLIRTKLHSMCIAGSNIRLRDLEEIKQLCVFVCDFGHLLSVLREFINDNNQDDLTHFSKQLSERFSFSTATTVFDEMFEHLHVFCARVSQLLSHPDSLAVMAIPVSSFEKRACGLDTTANPSSLSSSSKSSLADTTGLSGRRRTTTTKVGAMFVGSTSDQTITPERRSSQQSSTSRVSFSAAYRSPRSNTSPSSEVSSILKTPQLQNTHLLHSTSHLSSFRLGPGGSGSSSTKAATTAASAVDGDGIISSTLSNKEQRRREFMQRIEFFLLQIADHCLQLAFQMKDDVRFAGMNVSLYSETLQDLPDPLDSMSSAKRIGGVMSSVFTPPRISRSKIQSVKSNASQARRTRRKSYSVGDSLDSSTGVSPRLRRFSDASKRTLSEIAKEIYEDAGKPPLSVLLSLVNFSVSQLKEFYHQRITHLSAVARSGGTGGSIVSFFTPMSRGGSSEDSKKGGMKEDEHATRVMDWASIERCLWNVLTHGYTLLLFEWDVYLTSLFNERTADLSGGAGKSSSMRVMNELIENGNKHGSKSHKHTVKCLSKLHSRMIRFYAYINEYLMSRQSGSELCECDQRIRNDQQYLEQLTQMLHLRLFEHFGLNYNQLRPSIDRSQTGSVNLMFTSPAHSAAQYSAAHSSDVLTV